MAGKLLLFYRPDAEESRIITGMSKNLGLDIECRSIEEINDNSPGVWRIDRLPSLVNVTTGVVLQGFERVLTEIMNLKISEGNSFYITDYYTFQNG